MEKCDKCGHKSLRFRRSFGTYFCYDWGCRALFDKDKNFLSYDRNCKLIHDEQDNLHRVDVEKENNMIIKIVTYVLEEGKVTLRGRHPKLKSEKCTKPERLDCNFGVGYDRCEHMEYAGSFGNWKCKC